MATDYKFEGWAAHDPSAVEGKMVWQEIKPKAWEENDVDIQVTHCGMCGSDLHFLRNGWGNSTYPLTVGHEIVGKAVRVGKNVKHISVGDRVGVGAQGDSCLGRFGACHECEDGEENYCKCMRLDDHLYIACSSEVYHWHNVAWSSYEGSDS